MHYKTIRVIKGSHLGRAIRLGRNVPIGIADQDGRVLPLDVVAGMYEHVGERLARGPLERHTEILIDTIEVVVVDNQP